MKRAKWKGPFIQKKNNNNKQNIVKVLPRNYEITAQVVGLTCNVYSGKKLVKLNLTDEMIGHKAGEFSPTRAKFLYKKKKNK
jgi:small subunit ribosomal protein S19